MVEKDMKDVIKADVPVDVEETLKESNLIVYKVEHFEIEPGADNANEMFKIMHKMQEALDNEAPGCQSGIMVIPDKDMKSGSIVLYVDEDEFESKKKERKDKKPKETKNKKKGGKRKHK